MSLQDLAPNYFPLKKGLKGGKCVIARPDPESVLLVGAAVYAIIFLMIKGLSKEDMQLIREHLLTNAKG